MRKATSPSEGDVRPKLTVRFFRTASGREPVREWLKSLGQADRKAVGDDLRTVQFGWPMGMPLVRKIADDLWETRTDITEGIARVLFTIQQGEALLLHGFIKKSQKTPKDDLDTAKKRLKLVQRKD
jgi:phage-related protein